MRDQPRRGGRARNGLPQGGAARGRRGAARRRLSADARGGVLGGGVVGWRAGGGRGWPWPSLGFPATRRALSTHVVLRPRPGLCGRPRRVCAERQAARSGQVDGPDVGLASQRPLVRPGAAPSRGGRGGAEDGIFLEGRLYTAGRRSAGLGLGRPPGVGVPCSVAAPACGGRCSRRRSLHSPATCPPSWPGAVWFRS